MHVCMHCHCDATLDGDNHDTVDLAAMAFIFAVATQSRASTFAVFGPTLLIVFALSACFFHPRLIIGGGGNGGMSVC